MWTPYEKKRLNLFSCFFFGDRKIYLQSIKTPTLSCTCSKRLIFFFTSEINYVQKKKINKYKGKKITKIVPSLLLFLFVCSLLFFLLDRPGVRNRSPRSPPLKGSTIRIKFTCSNHPLTFTFRGSKAIHALECRLNLRRLNLCPFVYSSCVA